MKNHVPFAVDKHGIERSPFRFVLWYCGNSFCYENVLFCNHFDVSNRDKKNARIVNYILESLSFFFDAHTINLEEKSSNRRSRKVKKVKLQHVLALTLPFFMTEARLDSICKMAAHGGAWVPYSE